MKAKIMHFVSIGLCAALLFGSRLNVQAAGGSTDKQSAAGSAVEQEQKDYKIYVNRAANCVTIVTVDGEGTETPVKAMACSCGRAGHLTPTGTFKTTGYYEWCLMVDGTYGRYSVRFNKAILFHSVPYLDKTPDSLEWDQYNLLGESASLGCVRLCVADVKWIYDNCGMGTVVVVYDDAENPGLLGKPEMEDIDKDSPCRNWDPTDPDPENPWLKTLLNNVTYENFDAEKYADTYADIKAAFGTNKDLLWKHYLEHGRQEGRIVYTLPVAETYENFNASAYAARYPDVKAAFGTNKELLWKHYVDCGKQEGRKAF